MRLLNKKVLKRASVESLRVDINFSDTSILMLVAVKVNSCVLTLNREYAPATLPSDAVITGVRGFARSRIMAPPNIALKLVEGDGASVDGCNA